jgi:hypothetical protein
LNVSSYYVTDIIGPCPVCGGIAKQAIALLPGLLNALKDADQRATNWWTLAEQWEANCKAATERAEKAEAALAEDEEQHGENWRLKCGHLEDKIISLMERAERAEASAEVDHQQIATLTAERDRDYASMREFQAKVIEADQRADAHAKDAAVMRKALVEYAAAHNWNISTLYAQWEGDGSGPDIASSALASTTAGAEMLEALRKADANAKVAAKLRGLLEQFIRWSATLAERAGSQWADDEDLTQECHWLNETSKDACAALGASTTTGESPINPHRSGRVDDSPRRESTAGEKKE